jgi:hypothetical protein
LEYQYCTAIKYFDQLTGFRQHLYRHHRIYPCERCKELFSDDTQATHHRKNVECVRIDGELPDGLTESIERHLRKRKKTFKGQTEEDIWREIYRCIFNLSPEEETPSPSKLGKVL